MRLIDELFEKSDKTKLKKLLMEAIIEQVKSDFDQSAYCLIDPDDIKDMIYEAMEEAKDEVKNMVKSNVKDKVEKIFEKLINKKG